MTGLRTAAPLVEDLLVRERGPGAAPTPSPYSFLATGQLTCLRLCFCPCTRGNPCTTSGPVQELMTADELGRDFRVGLASEEGRAGTSSLVHMIEYRGGDDYA